MIKVAIADDSAIVRELLGDLLETDAEIKIVGMVEDGSDVFEVCEKDEPDILLLDVVMPHMDGLMTLDKLKCAKDQAVALGRPFPIIMMVSAIGNDEVTVKAMQSGADYFVRKPFFGTRIIEDIKHAVSSKNAAPEKPVCVCTGPDIETTRSYQLYYEAIGELLSSLGISGALKGFQFIRDSVVITLEDPEAVHSITKRIYPKIAERHDTTVCNVEHSIRHAIHSAYERDGRERFGRVFPCCRMEGGEDKVPTATRFITGIAETVKRGSVEKD